MKKQYIKPTIETVEVAHEVLMLTVSGEQDGVGTGKDPVGNETPSLSREHRGTWGNLWE